MKDRTAADIQFLQFCHSFINGRKIYATGFPPLPAIDRALRMDRSLNITSTNIQSWLTILYSLTLRGHDVMVDGGDVPRGSL